MAGSAVPAPAPRAYYSAMIAIDAVSKRYGAARARRAAPLALEGVSPDVPAGSVCAVAGPNGAGKSTLFALVLGFLHATAGEIRIAGEEPRRYVRRHGAGYLPERFALPGVWRVAEALRALARRERLGKGVRAAADAALERFGLAAVADARMSTLSHGQRQRVGLAQALLAPRALVVLDEPTEALDPLWRIRLREEIARLREDGRTVLVASHDLAEVERFADMVAVIDAGVVRVVLDIGRPAPADTYVLQLAAPEPRLAEAFADALPRDGEPLAFTVRVADAAELSARLAALLALGATVAAVQPLGVPLEERVRRTLDSDAS